MCGRVTKSRILSSMSPEAIAGPHVEQDKGH